MYAALAIPINFQFYLLLKHQVNTKTKQPEVTDRINTIRDFRILKKREYHEEGSLKTRMSCYSHINLDISELEKTVHKMIQCTNWVNGIWANGIFYVVSSRRVHIYRTVQPSKLRKQEANKKINHNSVCGQKVIHIMENLKVKKKK